MDVTLPLRLLCCCQGRRQFREEQHADSTPDEKAPKRRELSADEVLVEAARNGDTTAVRAGLEKLIPDTDNKTVAFDAVHEACRGNHDECLALLLPYVETTQMGFGMLLSECIHADHTACTEVLLQHWKSVCSNVAFVPHGQEADSEDDAPRPCPAMWEDPAVCQVLIDAGADIETKDEVGRSPLLRASVSGKFAVVKMLVEAGARVCVTDNYGDTCLTMAANCGHTETVRYLVGLPQVDLSHKDKEGYTSLLAAAENSSTDVVEVLIDAGSDVEAKCNDGRSPLLVASGLGNLRVVEVLVKAGADVCVTDNTRGTCLILAAANGHTETVRTLLCMPGVDVNKSNDRGNTSLHLAPDHSDVVQLLIDAGADVEAKNSFGSTPLHWACQVGELDSAQMLVKAGADVCAVDDESTTCLMLAAQHGHTATVRYLVDLNTALHHARQRQHADVVQVLLKHGAEE